MLRIEQNNRQLQTPTKFTEFFIDYPKNGIQGKKKRNPIVHYRDPKRRIFLDTGRISVVSLNKLLSTPLNTISTTSDCEMVALLGIQQGLRDKLFSREREKGKKLETVLLKDFILKYWDFDNSPYLKRDTELRGKSKGETYCKKAQRTFINNCLPIIGEDLRIDEFTPQLMEKIQLSMKENGKSNKTINEATSSIKIALGEAFRSGIISENIGDRIRLVKNSIKKERGILTEEEARKLLTYLKESTTPGTPGRKLYLITAIAYYGGLRAGEILSLKADSLRVEKNIIHVATSYNEREKRIKSTKNGEERESFPLPSQLMEELVEYSKLNEGGFLFPSPWDSERPWRETELSKAFSPTVETALGISKKEREERGIVFHSLRHGTATMMIAKGVDISLVKEGMGHKTRAMTEHYSKHETEEGTNRFIKATEGKIEYI